MPVNRQVTMAVRPVGEPKLTDFGIVDTQAPSPGPGQVLVKTLWLSLDPYMRGRMSEAKSYARSLQPGDVIVGGTVGQVEASNNNAFKPGDIVLGYAGWQGYYVTDGSDLRKIDPADAPIQSHLGALGMPVMTAYTGLLNIGQPKAGETVVVAAATGAVGALVGQIAKIRGARAVGVAGGPEKCKFLIDELGFDAAVDHRDPEMKAKLKAACPDGIDVYFENVGGAVWDAVFPLLNDFARIPLCGLIAHYNDTAIPEGPDRLPGLMRQALTKRLTLRGFIVSDFAADGPAFQRDMSQWIREGRVRYREDIVEGLDKAPEAFIGLLRGKNFGKLLVKVA